MTRTPIRQTAPRAELDEAAPAAGPKKTRLRRNSSQRSMLDLPADLMAKLHGDGIDVQWVTDSVLGKPEPATRQDFEINAWEPCTGQMFDGAFDGMFARKGYQGEITYNGLVLMWRPLELTKEAQAEERSARLNQLRAVEGMIKGGQGIPGLASGFEADHPTALAGNKLTRTVKPPMEIPAD